MSWLDRYREASFRKVPFYVSAHEFSGGRRVAVHEYPNADKPEGEDMGQRAGKFSIDAYILGDDYDLARDNLIEALNKKGSGTLVHPYLGNMQVSCDGFTIRETVAEGRIARFSIHFVEVGETVAPSAVQDTTGQALRSRASALAAAKTALINAYEMANKPYIVTQNVIDTLDKAIKAIDQAKLSAQGVANFTRELSNIQGKIIELAYNSVDLADTLVSLISFNTEDIVIDNAVSSAEYQLEEMLQMDIGLNALPAPKSTDDPSILIQQLSQVSAIICAAGLLVQVDFVSGNDAKESQNRVFDRLDTLLQSVADDDLYTSLMNLRRDVANDVSQRAITLPNVVEYIPNGTTTSLSLSYLLYNTIDKADEIVNRNHIPHPGMIMGGRTLEILRNV